jgi:PAS domain-containing protein
MVRRDGSAQDGYRYLPDHLTDPSLDRLATLAANLTGCPVARISVIDDHWVVCRASVGAPRLIVPSEQSFCALARTLGKPVAVNNPATDPLFAELTCLPHNQGVRFYAAQPLISASGAIIGILSLRDVLPHFLDDSERATLEDIAALAVERLETIAREHHLRSATASTKALEMASSSLGLAYWRFDAARNELFWSEGTAHLLGLDPAQPPSYRRFLGLLEKTERLRVCQLIHRALRRNLPFALKTTIVLADGTERRITLQGDCDGQKGTISCAYGIAFSTPDTHL